MRNTKLVFVCKPYISKVSRVADGLANFKLFTKYIWDMASGPHGTALSISVPIGRFGVTGMYVSIAC